MLRSILRIRLKDKVKLVDIFAKTGAKKVGVITKKLKYNFAGHMVRGFDSKWSKTLTTWVLHTGYRTRGRPVTRWEDEIKLRIGQAWKQKAKDRSSWRGLVGTNAQER